MPIPTCHGAAAIAPATHGHRFSLNAETNKLLSIVAVTYSLLHSFWTSAPSQQRGVVKSVPAIAVHRRVPLNCGCAAAGPLALLHAARHMRAVVPQRVVVLLVVARDAAAPAVPRMSGHALTIRAARNALVHVAPGARDVSVGCAGAGPAGARAGPAGVARAVPVPVITHALASALRLEAKIWVTI